MSESIVTRETPAVSRNCEQQIVGALVGQLRPEVDHLLDELTGRLQEVHNAERCGSEVRIAGRMGTTIISATSLGVPDPDGDVILEQLKVTTRIKRPLEWPPEAINYANRFAALSALVADSDTGFCSLVSRINTYEGWDCSLPLISHFVINAALMHDAGLAAACNHMFDLAGDRAWPAVVWDSPGQSWGPEDFREAETYLRDRNIFANAGASGLTAEYAWKTGAMSALHGDATSLVTVNANERHPILGQGLFFKVELPVRMETDNLISTANALNLMDRDALDAPPFFGGWTGMTASGRLAHVGFWPSIMYVSGLVPHLCAWLAGRNRLARGFVGNRKV